MGGVPVSQTELCYGVMQGEGNEWPGLSCLRVLKEVSGSFCEVMR